MAARRAAPILVDDGMRRRAAQARGRQVWRASAHAVAGRSVQVSRCPARAGDVDRSRRLGHRRSHRRLHGLPDELPAVSQGKPPARSPAGGQALWEVCRRTASLKPATAAEARAFFEENFRPVRITKLGDAEGFLTGYYEPIVQGSRFPNPEFSVPLYRRPRDLEAAGHKPRFAELPQQQDACRSAAATTRASSSPIPTAAQIEAGALDGQHLEICWVRDWFEALTIQIQGSARVDPRGRHDAADQLRFVQRPSLLVDRPRADRAQGDSARRNVDAAHQGLDEGQSRTRRPRCGPPIARSCSSASPASTTTASRSARRTCR